MGGLLRTELRGLLERTGIAPFRLKPALTHLLLLAVFGVLLPYYKGVEFMDPALPTIYACLGAFFAAPAAVQILRDGSAVGRYAVARVLAASIYGELMALVLTILGFATVLATSRTAYLFLPDPVYFGKALLMGAASTLALSAIGAWITLHLGGRIAMAFLRLCFVALLVMFVLRSWWLPSVTGIGAVVSFAAALLFLFLLGRNPAPRPL
jgi:hypothetical protein